MIEYRTPCGYDMAGKKPTKTREGKGRRKRRKMKLSLRSRSVKKTQDHRETAGWSKIQDPKKADDGPKDPEIIRHQCTYCGAMMRIPKPKRARYQVECSHPDCDHVDTIE